jgi:hypothetical protein
MDLLRNMIVPVINTIERTNWKTTNPLRNSKALGLNFREPFSTLTGLSDDKNNAG